MGLPLDWARDCRERLRACLESHGLNPNQKRIVIEVKSAFPLKGIRSSPSLFDLPILMGVLHCLRNTVSKETEPRLFALGEVLLSGHISHGNEDVFLEASCARQESSTICYVPKLSTGIETPADKCVVEVDHFSELLEKKGKQKPPSPSEKCVALSSRENEEWQSYRTSLSENLFVALSSWKSLPFLALAHVLALSSRRNLLIVGSPGAGKSHSTQFWPNLLPPLSESQRIERRLIEGALHLPWRRPFRSPHHSCSRAGLTGGSQTSLGEFTLSHLGVLYLDELLEFGRDRLEALREPLELRSIHLARAQGSCSLPANFQLLSCSNPCKCGYLLSRRRPCRCPAKDRARAWEKISGPLMDRFELKMVVDSSEDDEDSGKELAFLWDGLLENANAWGSFVSSFSELQRNAYGLTTLLTEGAPKSDAQNNFAVGGSNFSRRAQVQESQLQRTLEHLFPLWNNAKNGSPNFPTWIHRLRNIESVLQKQILGDLP